MIWKCSNFKSIPEIYTNSHFLTLYWYAFSLSIMTTMLEKLTDSVSDPLFFLPIQIQIRIRILVNQLQIAWNGWLTQKEKKCTYFAPRTYQVL